MKLRSKKIMAVLMASTIATGAFAVSAANLTKNVQLRYNNINVKVDGQYKVPNMEPFFIGDSVYVSLRDAGQLIGSQVNWNGTTNTVEINTSSIANSALETELAARNHELAVAKSEMQKMQAKIEQYEKKLGITDDKEDDKDTDKEDNKDEDNSITSSDLKDMLKKLDKYYSDKYDVEWEFTLKGNEKGLRLVMEYDSKADGKAFKEISKSSLEKFAKDIMRDIQSDLGKIKVEGKIYDTREEVTKAEFTMSTKGVFDFEYNRNNNITDKDLNEFAKILEDKYGKFPELNFGATFDGSSIRVRSIKLVQDGNKVEFEIYTDYANMSIAKKAWDNMSGASEDKVEKYLDDIQEEIEKEFDVDATGYVFNESKEIIATYNTSLKLN